MRTATFAAAAASLAGAAMADGWENWGTSSTTTTKDAVTTTSATTKDVVSSTTWSDWSSTTSATTKDPETTSSTTWSEWTSTTSATTKDPETTSSTTWSEWTTTSSATTKDPETTSSVEWEQWSTTTSATTKDPETTSSVEWETWAPSSSSSTKDPVTSSSETWSAWTSSAATTKIPVTTAASSSWSAWESDVVTTISKTATEYVTVTVYPVDQESSTWSVWSSTADADTTSTKTENGVTTVTGTVTSTASWSAWPTATDGQCAMQISVSYGQPIWKPTPTLAANTTSWETWSATSSTTNEAVTTSSTTDSATWSTWSTTSSATTKDVVTTSSTTDAATWSTWAATEGSNTWTSASSSAASSTWSSWSGSATNGWTTSSGGLTANGNKFGMTYSPYTDNSGCKDASTVMADISKLASKGFTSVRVYSTDCETLENVGAAARASNIKMILGVFIDSSGIEAAQPQVSDITAWAQWDLVELIVVGNEALFNGYCSASDLAAFIGSSKSAFQAAGYKGLVTTTEELSIWQSQGSALCDVIDISAANLYAFFNAQTTASQAGDLITAQIGILESICPGKESYVMECGWPTAGECNGVACPSPENQATALKSIQAVTGAKIVFFSFEDEMWKQPGQFGVEQHWGCADVF